MSREMGLAKVENPEKTDWYLLSSSLLDSRQIRTYKVAEDLIEICKVIILR